MKNRKITTLLSIIMIFSLLFSGCAKAQPVEKQTENLKDKITVEKNIYKTVENKEEKSTIRLEDDYYEYVNGKLLKEKKESAKNGRWDNLEELENKINGVLKKELSEIEKNNDKFSKDSAEVAIHNIYKTALDMETREKVGFGSLSPYLEAIKSAKTVEEYVNALAKINNDLGKASLLSFGPSPDPKNSKEYALFIDDPTMIVSKAHLESKEIFDITKLYIEKLLVGFGYNEEESKKWTDEIIKFHNELGEVALDRKDSNDVEKTTNFFTFEELQKQISNIDLKSFLKYSGQDGFKNLVVTNPKSLPFVNKHLTNEKLELMKTYSLVTLLNEYSPYLNGEYRKAAANFKDLEDNASDLAWDVVGKLSSMEMGEIYAKKSFSPEKKQAAEKLVRDIIEAYRKNIDKLDWLSKESKEEAKKKLDTMRVKVGYPENYKSFVKGVVKSPAEGGNLIDNAIAIDKATAENERMKSTMEVNKDEWGLSPQTLNAYYDSSTNEIIFPAAMLQAPFFDTNQSYAKNLGGIGAVIGHEITHAFDDAGSLYDSQGNYRSWWTDSDKKAFEEKSKKYIEHFGAIEAVPGHKVDGELTLGENIADTGGVSVVASILGDDKVALREMFESYALSWASLLPDEDVISQLQFDEHSPAKVRVNGVLSNSEAFYKAYEIKSGDKMFVEPEKRVKMH